MPAVVVDGGAVDAARAGAMVGWLCLFRSAAISHLVWAVLFLATDPRGRWDFPAGMSGQAMGNAQPALRYQLVAADRQVVVGFLVCAFLARSCRPHGLTGVRAAVVLLLWNAALLVNTGGYNRLRGRRLLASPDMQMPTFAGHIDLKARRAWFDDEDFPLELTQLLLIAHGCIVTSGLAAYLIFFFVNRTLVSVNKWVQETVAERRRVAAAGESAGSGYFASAAPLLRGIGGGQASVWATAAQLVVPNLNADARARQGADAAAASSPQGVELESRGSPEGVGGGWSLMSATPSDSLHGAFGEATQVDHDKMV